MDWLVMLLVAVGALFFLGGTLGILRFPDFYSRLHPAGKLDTLASLLVMAGLAIHNLQHFTLDNLLVSIKIILIVAFVFMASPTATHAIVDAGVRAGLTPWQRPERKKRR